VFRLGWCLAACTPLRAAQPIESFLLPEPLPRLALLVGMSDYENLVDLSNVPSELDSLEVELDRLGFSEIFVVKNPCLAKVYDAIDAFDARISELAPDGGAIVWTFIAGHGAMSSHDQYVVATDFHMDHLVGNKPHQIALPTAYLEDNLRSRRVGAGVIAIDACRSQFAGLSAFVTQSRPSADMSTCPGMTQVWRKRSQTPAVDRIGYVTPRQFGRLAVVYSVRPGSETTFDNDPARLSAYVGEIVTALRASDVMIPGVFESAYENLMTLPVRSFYATELDIRLKGIKDTRLDGRADAVSAQKHAQTWRETLEVGETNPHTVEIFVKDNPTSDYLRPALRWLKQRAPRLVAPDVVVVEGRDGEALLHVTTRESIVVYKYPVNDLPQPTISRRLDGLELSSVRPGWARIASAREGEPQFVPLKPRADDPAELQEFWKNAPVVDLTDCVNEAKTMDGCLARLLAELKPDGQREVVNVLALEPTRDSPAPLTSAFDRALAVQRALDRLGIPYARSRIHVQPAAFAPLWSGRTIARKSD
jgi:hypothetical protein